MRLLFILFLICVCCSVQNTSTSIQLNVNGQESFLEVFPGVQRQVVIADCPDESHMLFVKAGLLENRGVDSQACVVTVCIVSKAFYYRDCGGDINELSRVLLNNGDLRRRSSTGIKWLNHSDEIKCNIYISRRVSAVEWSPINITF